jgi:hypothetical protein
MPATCSWPGLEAGEWLACGRLLALRVRNGKRRLGSAKADQLPAGEVLVAAIDRGGEHAFRGVGADVQTDR